MNLEVTHLTTCKHKFKKEKKKKKKEEEKVWIQWGVSQVQIQKCKGLYDHESVLLVAQPQVRRGKRDTLILGRETLESLYEDHLWYRPKVVLQTKKQKKTKKKTRTNRYHWKWLTAGNLDLLWQFSLSDIRRLLPLSCCHQLLPTHGNPPSTSPSAAAAGLPFFQAISPLEPRSCVLYLIC